MRVITEEVRHARVRQAGVLGAERFALHEAGIGRCPARLPSPWPSPRSRPGDMTLAIPEKRSASGRDAQEPAKVSAT